MASTSEIRWISLEDCSENEVGLELVYIYASALRCFHFEEGR